MTPWILGAASPFATAEEFAGAIDGPTGGAIYTFADRPAINGILIVVSALMFIYFLYSAFHTKINDAPPKSLATLGALFLAGAVSLGSAVYDAYAARNAQEASHRRPTTQAIASNSRPVPPALVGLVGMLGLPKIGRRSQKRRRKAESDRYSRF